MKKIIFIILILTTSRLFGVTPELDSIFMELDHTQMQTKYLWDKQIRLFDPLLFDGTSSNDQFLDSKTLKRLSDQFSYSNVRDTSDTSQSCMGNKSWFRFYFKFDSLFNITNVFSSFSECYKDSIFVEYYAYLGNDESKHNYYEITKIDTSDKYDMIFSGNFRGTYESEIGTTVEITNGRFDVELSKRKK